MTPGFIIVITIMWIGALVSVLAREDIGSSLIFSGIIISNLGFIYNALH